MHNIVPCCCNSMQHHEFNADMYYTCCVLLCQLRMLPLTSCCCAERCCIVPHSLLLAADLEPTAETRTRGHCTAVSTKLLREGHPVALSTLVRTAVGALLKL
eukprot:21028-Heterococcus_DN1.PRE.3